MKGNKQMYFSIDNLQMKRKRRVFEPLNLSRAILDPTVQVIRLIDVTPFLFCRLSNSISPLHLLGEYRIQIGDAHRCINS